MQNTINTGYQYRLVKEVLKLSVSQDWEIVRKEEWNVIDFEKVDLEYCICSHVIRNVFHMFNVKNNNTFKCGNCCINQFKNKELNKQANEFKKEHCDICNCDVLMLRQHKLSNKHKKLEEIHRLLKENRESQLKSNIEMIVKPIIKPMTPQEALVMGVCMECNKKFDNQGWRPRCINCWIKWKNSNK